MGTILVIEDNPANMKLASLLLRNAGHSVLCAGDAETGLTIARADQPDLILMDIQLPGMDGLAATALLKQDPVTAPIPVIAVTAMAMKADEEKSQVAGCDAYIAKPLRYQELYSAIDKLLARVAPQAPGEAKSFNQAPARTPLSRQPDAAATPPSRDEAIRDGRLILVAEDNEINQKLILRQLALLGFAGDVADNGSVALERWKSGNYALLLCDLHMPEMDGYALTAAIRAKEQDSRRIPILALTANALSGEADRCRMAGMDDCLGKPLQLAGLKVALETWLPGAASGLHLHAAPDARATVVQAVDVSVLESLIGNDPAVILEFLNDFLTSAARIALELRAACAEGRPVQAGEHAHKLKSSARAVGALALGELCAQMETAGKAENVETLTALLHAFERELDTVCAYIDRQHGRRTCVGATGSSA